MNGLAIFLIIVIFIVLIVGIVILIPLIKSLRKPIVTGKHITNHLHKYTQGYKYGALIDIKPTGKDRGLARIRFTVKAVDEYGHDMIAEKCIVAKRGFVRETTNDIEILPKMIPELDFNSIDYKELEKKIREQTGIDAIAEATERDKRKFLDLLVDKWGGELTRTEISRNLELLKMLKDEQLGEVKKP